MRYDNAVVEISQVVYRKMIYSFRGSDVDGFVEWLKRYDFKIWNMGQNYRSTKTIVNGADSVVKHNSQKIDGEVFTENPLGQKITVVRTKDPDGEMKAVTRAIKGFCANGYKHEDIAVLSRLKRGFGRLEQEFIKENIPYHIVGGTSFMERKEVKQLMSYIRLLVNSNDTTAFEIAVNIPIRYVGDITIGKILDKFEDEYNKDSLYNVVKNFDPQNSRIRAGLDSFITDFDNLCEFAADVQEDEDYSVADLIREVYRMTNFENHILKNLADDERDFLQRKGNVEELINMAREYSDPVMFVESLVNEKNDEEDGTNEVNVMTVHASKGLEFPVVIVINCNENSFPFYRAVQDGYVEEERRLFYVALTRAKKFCVLTLSSLVSTNYGVTPGKESRFIAEIDKQYVSRR